MHFTAALFIAPVFPLLASPDAAVLILTIGILLTYLELNRPGSIVPGAFGLLLILLSAASLMKASVVPLAASLAFLSLAMFAANLRRSVHLSLLLGSTVCLVVSLAHLTRKPAPHPITAALCGFLIGGVTSILTSIARRARANKRVD